MKPFVTRKQKEAAARLQKRYPSPYSFLRTEKTRKQGRLAKAQLAFRLQENKVLWAKKRLETTCLSPF